LKRDVRIDHRTKLRAKVNKEKRKVLEKDLKQVQKQKVKVKKHGNQSLGTIPDRVLTLTQLKTVILDI